MECSTHMNSNQNNSDTFTYLKHKFHRYVADALDDNVEPRTRKAIPNFHGIVKYEIVWQPTVDKNEPTSGWQLIPLKESYSAQRALEDGSGYTM
ncbi:hypothetical protein DPMN_089438 [Dreissena polymorpha]|uniref:Uncharacterized protein n=1 Tax=Dreissena polymorpha TaxID=45954 RepID=A0A9D4QY31_DREPO|nr:hypothetical protein DPMN_089438 [Dreissena polymorpha]